MDPKEGQPLVQSDLRPRIVILDENTANHLTMSGWSRGPLLPAQSMRSLSVDDGFAVKARATSSAACWRQKASKTPRHHTGRACRGGAGTFEARKPRISAPSITRAKAGSIFSFGKDYKAQAGRVGRGSPSDCRKRRRRVPNTCIPKGKHLSVQGGPTYGPEGRSAAGRQPRPHLPKIPFAFLGGPKELANY